MNGRRAIDIDCPTRGSEQSVACTYGKSPCQARVNAAVKLTKRLNALAKLAFYDKKK